MGKSRVDAVKGSTQQRMNRYVFGRLQMTVNDGADVCCGDSRRDWFKIETTMMRAILVLLLVLVVVVVMVAVV